jgi:hypothetical protein
LISIKGRIEEMQQGLASSSMGEELERTVRFLATAI